LWIKDLWPPSYKKKAALNAYPLGDLDDPYWKDANFLALEENGEISEIALLYSGIKIPILIAIENNSAKKLSYLLQEIKANFPNRLYAHLSQRQRETMLKYYSASSHGLHQIMELKNSGFLNQIETDNVERVNHEEIEKILALFNLAYPDHCFERKMLDYGPILA